ESFPKKGTGDGADPTVREFLPWHVVQKKLAARASGVDVTREDDDLEEEGPDSGVQESVSVRVAANDGDPPLTYKVYTVADLDAAPPSSRMSMVAAAEREPSPWMKS